MEHRDLWSVCVEFVCGVYMYVECVCGVCVWSVCRVRVCVVCV